jgi:hypothetical protein
LLKLYIQNALVKLAEGMYSTKMEFRIQNKTVHSMLFADDQLKIAQDYEYLEYMTRKLIDEYDLWGLKLMLKKPNTWPYGHTSRDLQLDDGNRIIRHVHESTYLGVK